MHKVLNECHGKIFMFSALQNQGYFLLLGSYLL